MSSELTIVNDPDLHDTTWAEFTTEDWSFAYKPLTVRVSRSFALSIKVCYCYVTETRRGL